MRFLDRWAFETGTLRDFIPQFVGSKCSAVSRLTGISNARWSNTLEIVRNDNGTNYFPPGYVSFDTNVYGSFNKALVYCDEKNRLILPPADLNNVVVVKMV